MNAGNPRAEIKIDVPAEKVQRLFFEFLQSFELDPEGAAADGEKEGTSKAEKVRYYIQLVQELKVNDKKTMYINFAHLSQCDPTFELRESLLTNFYRYGISNVG